jgi:hypothetical protein
MTIPIDIFKLDYGEFDGKMFDVIVVRSKAFHPW